MKTNKIVVEIRRQEFDNVVATIEHSSDSSINPITAGYEKICNMLKINKVEASRHFYVDVTKK